MAMKSATVFLRVQTRGMNRRSHMPRFLEVDLLGLVPINAYYQVLT